MFRCSKSTHTCVLYLHQIIHLNEIVTSIYIYIYIYIYINCTLINMIIPSSNSYKNVDIVVDDKLSFTYHILSVTNSSKRHLLRINTDFTTKLTYTLIHYIINYG